MASGQWETCPKPWPAVDLAIVSSVWRSKPKVLTSKLGQSKRLFSLALLAVTTFKQWERCPKFANPARGRWDTFPTGQTSSDPTKARMKVAWEAVAEG